MKKRIILSIIILTIAAFAALFIWRQNQMEKNTLLFPPEPTQEERDAAKKLPKNKCPCWVEIDNFCHPLSDCV